MELHGLSGGSDARKKRKRIGRGNASGHGRTAGRGEKGQLARSGGKVRAGFEGGQMPLYRRVPKVGFRSRKKTLGLNQYVIVNMNVLEQFDEGAVVDPDSLASRGIKTAGKAKAGIKILGRGKLTKKLAVKAHAVSKAARSQIEAVGGSIELLG